MIDDVYEPLVLFRDSLKAEHEKNTAALFEELVRRSGVDEAANAATVGAVRALDGQLATQTGRLSRWQFARALAWMVAVICAVTLVLFGVSLFDQGAIFAWWWAVAAAVGGGGTVYGVLTKINPLLRAIREQVDALQKTRAAKIAEATRQMEPLNRLFDWDMPARLVQKTVPRLELDPWLANGRLDELRRSFGWSDEFNSNKSVLCTQSGVINGNPFVLAETLDFRMGSKTYTGTKTISWRELERYTDSQGRSRTRYVTRYQTLTATVTKPAPEHNRGKFVIYGNEAAPTLTFSRAPSQLSNADDGIMGKWRKGREVKKLEKLSRNLDDDSGYTIMANKDFDALFHAIDRNDEVQFRLLFTPLAQQQMLALLRDRQVGYGDDFHFVKAHMINIVRPNHLMDIDLSAAPALYQSYDLAEARQRFNDYNNRYFRAFFFAMAPLLTIPLYQQHRSHEDIYRDVYSRDLSFWEYESMANIHGQEKFRHPASVTPNILKTAAGEAVGRVRQVTVTAHGFRGEPRIDYISKLGGDGRYHDVPVHWTEYIPVSNSAGMVVRETGGLARHELEEGAAAQEWRDFFTRWQTEPARALCRRSFVSLVTKGSG